MVGIENARHFDLRMFRITEETIFIKDSGTTNVNNLYEVIKDIKKKEGNSCLVIRLMKKVK